jgi:dihydrofolate synthase/folylpolyglutamate synthase
VNYQEALAYLYSLSDFERSGLYNRNPEENLPRESRLLEVLGNPHHNYTNTLIAGTKGKGSTAAFIERVLRQAGLRVGLYTQPDLHTFRERIRVNGRLISENEVAELLPEVRAAVESVQAEGKFGPFITYEVATALALLYFSRQHVEHAVLEVGLGGRLDATNVTQPLVSVLTSISYDHTQILGETLTEIATEKSGIIKPNGVVVTSARAPEALLAIAAVCQQRHAHMVRIGSAEGDPAQAEVDAGRLPALSYRYRLEERSEQHQRFTVWGAMKGPPGAGPARVAPTQERVYTGLEIPLAGQHQLENATAALATLELLRERGIMWDEEALRAGFQAVRWPARIEVVEHSPMIVVDGAHNADSMQQLKQALRSSFTFQRLIMVLSVARDKDLVGIARALADVDTVILTRMMNPRAATIEQLHAVFAEHAPQVRLETSSDSSSAMKLALDLAESSDLICAAGSLYLAAEVLRWAAARGDREAAATIESVDH